MGRGAGRRGLDERTLNCGMGLHSLGSHEGGTNDRSLEPGTGQLSPRGGQQYLEWPATSLGRLGTECPVPSRLKDRHFGCGSAALRRQQVRGAKSIKRLTGLLWAWLFFVVDRNRIQIFSLEDLVAIETPDVIDPVAAIEQFGSLVLASLHNEVKLILECMKTVSSAKGESASETEI